MKQMCLLTNAKRGIVIGVFTGYSALCFAEGLTNDGKLVCLDVDAESVNMGLPFLKQAGVANKMDVRIGPALETLEKMKQ